MIFIGAVVFTVCALISGVDCATAGVEWCYHLPSCNDSTWATIAPQYCNGSRQSPINIDTKAAKGDSNLTSFTFTNFNSTTALKTIKNTGKTVLVTFESGVQISGGGLSEAYNSLQFHLHWGKGSSIPGSEHAVDGKRYPMAMHIVNIKSSYNGNLTQVVADPKGIAALGFLIEPLSERLGVCSDKPAGPLCRNDWVALELHSFYSYFARNAITRYGMMDLKGISMDKLRAVWEEALCLDFGTNFLDVPISFTTLEMSGNATGEPASWKKFASYLANISNKGQSVSLPAGISLDDLLVGVNRAKYYRYLGSLTTPSCFEAVVWTVFKEPIKLSKDLIDLFSTKVHVGESSSAFIVNNYRNIQKDQPVTTQPESSASTTCYSLGLMLLSLAQWLN